MSFRARALEILNEALIEECNRVSKLLESKGILKDKYFATDPEHRFTRIVDTANKNPQFIASSDAEQADYFLRLVFLIDPENQAGKALQTELKEELAKTAKRSEAEQATKTKTTALGSTDSVEFGMESKSPASKHRPPMLQASESPEPFRRSALSPEASPFHPRSDSSSPMTTSSGSPFYSHSEAGSPVPFQSASSSPSYSESESEFEYTSPVPIFPLGTTFPTYIPPQATPGFTTPKASRGPLGSRLTDPVTAVPTSGGAMPIAPVFSPFNTIVVGPQAQLFHSPSPTRVDNVNLKPQQRADRGNLAFQQGYYQTAFDYLKTVVSEPRELNVNEEVKLLFNLAKCYLILGKGKVKAINYLKTAFNVARKNPLVNTVLLREIAETAKALGISLKRERFKREDEKSEMYFDATPTCALRY